MALFGVAFVLTWPSDAASHSSSQKAAAQPSVSLGHVSSRVQRPGIERVFRSTLEQELLRLDLDVDEPYVLRASLVRMSSKARGKLAKTRCLVSVTLHRGRGGELLAMMRGRATIEDKPSVRQRSELRVMRRAVRGALRQLGTALDR